MGLTESCVLLTLAIAAVQAQVTVPPTRRLSDVGKLVSGVFTANQHVAPKGVKVTWETVGVNKVIAIALAHLPGSQDDFLYLGGDGNFAGVFNLQTRKWTPVVASSNPFCSSIALLHTGRAVNFGGHVQYGNTQQGLNDIRFYDPWRNQTSLPVIRKMDFPRWYPTATLLPNHKVLVAGGTVQPVENSAAPPFDEIWDPARPLAETQRVRVEPTFLKAVKQYFYPFNYVLPTGEILVHCDGLTRIRKLDGSYRYVNGRLVTGPAFPAAISTQYPRSGTSFMGALKPNSKGEYPSVDIYIYGGQHRNMKCQNNNQDANTPASSKMYKMHVSWEWKNHQWVYTFSGWEEEDLWIPRVGGDSVMLPNGKVMMVSGAQTGCSGYTLKSKTKPNWRDTRNANPAFWVQLYQPDKPRGQRLTILDATPVARMYHSSAALTLDGNVLVAGCDTCQATWFTSRERGKFWSELDDTRNERRNELLKTPWYYDTAHKPSIRSINGHTSATKLTWVSPGHKLTIKYDPKVPITDVVLVAPTSTTHGFNSNQRVVFLRINSNSRKSGTVVTYVPRSQSVTMAQYYMLFLLNKDTYSRARWIILNGQLPANYM